MEDVLDGFNSSVLVMGPAKSGKTLSMLASEQGIMPQAARFLFTRIQQMQNQVEQNQEHMVSVHTHTHTPLVTSPLRFFSILL